MTDLFIRENVDNYERSLNLKKWLNFLVNNSKLIATHLLQELESGRLILKISET